MSQYGKNLADALDEAREIRRICDKRFGKGRAELDELVRSNARGIVFYGRFRGQEAVFKLMRDPTAESVAPLHGVREILERYEAAFAGLPFHVNPFLGAVPWKGLIILGRVPGHAVAEIFEEGDAERGRQATRALCGWLDAARVLGDEVVEFNPGFLLGEAARFDLDPLPEADARLLRANLAALEGYGRAIQGQPMRRSVGHSDCHSGNFHLTDEGALWAFDLQDTARMPLARMAAKFIGLKLWKLDSEGPYDGGALASDMQILREHLPLASGEGEGPLRFFLGYEILNGFVRNARRKWSPTNRQACLEAMLSGLTRKEGI
ncbi:hypothetical protein [Aliiroseovarius sp.]|uniref:hypothetical protein n=1 Tax=Aliiroseovarius sp. TaxID=1872442 RepID=UPI003BAAC33D